MLPILGLRRAEPSRGNTTLWVRSWSWWGTSSSRGARDEHPQAGGWREGSCRAPLGRRQGPIAQGCRSCASRGTRSEGSRTPRLGLAPRQRKAAGVKGSVWAEVCQSLCLEAMLKAWLSPSCCPSPLSHAAMASDTAASLEPLMSPPLFLILGCGHSSGTGCTVPFAGTRLPSCVSSARSTDTSPPKSRPGMG